MFAEVDSGAERWWRESEINIWMFNERRMVSVGIVCSREYLTQRLFAMAAAKHAATWSRKQQQQKRRNNDDFGHREMQKYLQWKKKTQIQMKDERNGELVAGTTVFYRGKNIYIERSKGRPECN